MKKQMMFLTVLSALACMTGCGTDSPAANANSTAQTTAQTIISSAETTAVTSTALQTTANATTAANVTTAAQTTAAHTTAAAKTTAKKLSLDTAQYLFGGYVATKDNAALNLRSQPNTSAESLAMIPCETQLNIYGNGTRGWYLTEYQGKVGYVKSEFIKEIQSYDSASADDPFDEYIGQWKSAEQWKGNDFTIQITRNRKTMNVEVSSHSAAADYLWNYPCICSDDATFINCTGKGTLTRTVYAPNGEKQKPVTVYSDGSARFNINGGTLFWDDGKEGTAHQVGFKQQTASPADIAGRWLYQLGEKDGGLVVVNEDGSYTFMDPANKTVNGTVRVEYEEHPDGTKSAGYRFYHNGTEFWIGCFRSEESSWILNVGQDETARLVLDMGNASSGSYLRVLLNYIGTWYEADVLDSRTLYINEDGTFRLEYRGGGAMYGNIELENIEKPDGSTETWLNFYDTEGKLLTGVCEPSIDRVDDICFGQDGTMHFVRAKEKQN